ncbi:tyrosine-type recombinase/integrase [Streptomyces sp. NPDC046976]|uniref:tyrosine-type recombinase/integrase n=1 Tax=Streptomyces sp. NPDC046976 TaxID=3155258 RepID=UPI0033FE9AE6
MSHELTTARECAALWGVSYDTARRILAPVEHVDRDPETGAMRYDRADAEAARASQPGRGRRVDLHGPFMSGEDAQRLTADESIPAVHRALWALVQSGMGVSEALRLDLRDVDLQAGEVVVKSTRKRPRTVPLSEHAAELARQAMADRSEGPLFVNEEGRPVTRYSAGKFAQAVAGAPIHAFKTRPHVMEPERWRSGMSTSVPTRPHVVESDGSNGG